MKYSNAGLEVRLCSENCIEDVHSYSEREIHCCNDDACNESPSLNHPTIISLITLLLVSCFALWATKHHCSTRKTELTIKALPKWVFYGVKTDVVHSQTSWRVLPEQRAPLSLTFLSHKSLPTRYLDNN
jgi:hypothetical protein